MHIYIITNAVEILIEFGYVGVASPKIFFLIKKYRVIKGKVKLIFFGYGSVSFNVRGSRIGIAFQFKKLQIIYTRIKPRKRRAT